MIDDEAVASEPAELHDVPKSWASRHPKLMILLIAGVFYIILFSMCAFILVLLLRG